MINDKGLDNIRYAGIDILKILSMALITLIHYFGYSSVADNQNLLLSNKMIISVLGTLTKVAVNIFPMITGYLLYNKKPKTLRIFKLYSEGWFYSFSLFLVGLIITQNVIFSSKALYSIFPFLTMHYWYLTAVIILYLLSPFLNIMLNIISENKLLKCILIAGLFISIYYVTNPFVSSDIYIGHSHGIIWLSYLYLLGGYIKKRNCQCSEKQGSKKIWAFMGLSAFIIIFILKYLNMPSSIKNAQLLSDYSILPFILTLSVFILVKDINIKSYKIRKVIAGFAECSFGVYLLQEHTMIRKFYWSVFDANKYAHSYFFILQLLCSVLILWLFAYVGHFLYKKIFNLIGIKVFNRITKTLSSLSFIKKQHL
ncbi:MAG: acyltransferase [Clostridia bacterium]|nr:acyltransferase [Clostridia bacterium]